MKRTLPILAALLALAAVCSCQSNTTDNGGAGGTGDVGGSTSDSDYTYPELDFGGDKIYI